MDMESLNCNIMIGINETELNKIKTAAIDWKGRGEEMPDTFQRSFLQLQDASRIKVFLSLPQT